MNIAKNIGIYMKQRGINLSEASRQTGVSYQALYASLYDENSNRDLRSEELISLCMFLEVDPMDFAKKEKEGVRRC